MAGFSVELSLLVLLLMLLPLPLPSLLVVVVAMSDDRATSKSGVELSVRGKWEGQNNETLMIAPRGRDANRQDFTITCKATREPSQVKVYFPVTQTTIDGAATCIGSCLRRR